MSGSASTLAISSQRTMPYEKTSAYKTNIKLSLENINKNNSNNNNKIKLIVLIVVVVVVVVKMLAIIIFLLLIKTDNNTA